MVDPSITYYPVGNGDTGLITLGDGTTIVIDVNATEACKDKEDKTHYDVPEALRNEAHKDADGRLHHDTFVLSHPDQDHVCGFTGVFYTGDPAKYADSDKADGKIIIDELWHAPRIFAPVEEKNLCEEAKAFKAEADRRMKLHKAKAKGYSSAGNRIRVIGYTDNPDLKGLDDVTTVPGSVLNLINGVIREGFEFFVHGPFKKDTDAEWGKRNDTSVVLQARFTVEKVERAALAIFGGDAECGVWEEIVDRSNDESLQWDLLLAPHHCSWSALSEEPSEDGKPSKKVLKFLDKRRKGAVVVASCKPIKDDDDNPPHHRAAELYREKVDKENFYCTMEHPSEQEPRPIHFRMTRNGPQKKSYGKADEVAAAVVWKKTVETPKGYG
ncbi:MAG: hypothetical protein M0T85_05135 [Dehalococcoidales bacterium]|nr:hypothetical protein [Dehalococcoidales bacterium]